MLHAAPLLFLSALAPQDGDSVMDRLSFYANGRLRAESTFDQTNGEDRHRGRLRFRVGARYAIMEDLRAEARLSTASDGRDPNNPHWDFGDGSDGLQGADVVLDRFFLTWDASDDLELRGGKFPHVYAAPPVYGEYVWDDDVHPAGVAGIWTAVSGEETTFDLRGAGYVIEENGSDDDPSMLGLQAHVRRDLGSNTELAAASSFSVWGSLDAGSFANQGNTVDGGGMIDEDFSVWDTFVSASHSGGLAGKQVGFVQYINNVDDDSGEDTGFAVGIELGTRNPGDTSFFASWYDFDANAFFSPPAQDDTPIGGTGTGMGMSGIVAGVRHIVSNRVALRLWTLTSDADDVEDPWRVRFDIDFNVN